jgi:hypothetical protein
MKSGKHVPILRYFLYVGAALLAVLLVVDAGLPRAEVKSETVQAHPEIRIASTITRPPAISFSGQTVDYGVKQDLQVMDLAAKADDPRTRAYAHASEAAPPQAKVQTAAKPAPQRVRKRYARRPAPRPEQQPAENFGWPTFNVVSGLRF